MAGEYELVNDEEVPENTVIPDDGWALKVKDSIVVINFMKFADKPNEDGTCNVEIDFDVVEGEKFDGIKDLVGEACVAMLEDSMKVRAMKEAREESENARSK